MEQLFIWFKHEQLIYINSMSVIPSLMNKELSKGKKSMLKFKQY